MSDPEMDDRIGVLVVDDDEAIVVVVAEILEASGYRARGITDPREALPEIDRGDYRVLLLDLMMPHIHGLNLLAQVRETHAALEVLLFSAATPDFAQMVTALRLDADDFLTKPLSADDLLAAVARAVDLRARRVNAYLEQEFGMPLSEVRRALQLLVERTASAEEKLGRIAGDIEGEAHGVASLTDGG